MENGEEDAFAALGIGRGERLRGSSPWAFLVSGCADGFFDNIGCWVSFFPFLAQDGLVYFRL